jgi:hypothetical protein
MVASQNDHRRCAPILSERPVAWLASRLSLKEEPMNRLIIAALIICFAVSTGAAQSCDSKAVGANGKPLHGAAKMSFVRKCKRDACAGRAVSAEGKPLYGAAKRSFMAKCERGA